MKIKAVSVRPHQASVESCPSGMGEGPGEHTVSLTQERGPLMGQTSEHRENWECFFSRRSSGPFHKRLQSNFSLNSGYCGYMGKGVYQET